MNTGKTVFAQLMEHLPLHEFRKCTNRYKGNYKIKTFSCLDQFLVMAFAQLSYRESLRDIEACLRAMSNKLYHMGIRGGISRNNLAHANETRDWRIWADFAQVLVHTARHLYADDPFGVELDQNVYAFDSTTIDLCLLFFPGRDSENTRPPSSSTRFWICAARSLRLSRLPREKSTMSMSWTISFQKQFPIPKTLFACDRQILRIDLGSNHHACDFLFSRSLSGETPARSLLRCRNKKAPLVSDQQLFLAR